jgi:hypothetical protein
MLALEDCNSGHNITARSTVKTHQDFEANKIVEVCSLSQKTKKATLNKTAPRQSA